jgi:DNA-binding transcriptional regulator YdaS (Cro superfamily)
MPVYFVRAGENGPVKIGHAKNPASRLRELQAGCFEKFNLLRVIEGDVLSEKFLHRHFRAQRVRGEWFRFHIDMLTIVPPPLHAAPRQKRDRDDCGADALAALDTAFRAVGGREALAEHLGICRTATYHWVDNKIPAEHAAMIEVLTAGEVTFRQLRPDIFKTAARRAS